MEEYEIEVGGRDAWTVGIALSKELASSWRAEVQEYDVTPDGGTIILTVPNDRRFRIQRVKVRTAQVRRLLEASTEMVSESKALASGVSTYLEALASG